jgi:hypothetical protein
MEKPELVRDTTPQELFKLFDQQFESREWFRKRMELLKNKLVQQCQGLPPGKKACFVAHLYVIEALTCEYYTEDHMPVKGSTPANLEVVAIL